MKTSQSFPFYPSDFVFGTMMMTPAQVGGYMRALCYQWETGGFPSDENHQKLITGCCADDLHVILKKFQQKRGVYVNARLERVRKEREHYIEIQRLNGKKGGRPKWKPKPNPSLTQAEPNTKTQIKANQTLPSPSPSPSPSPNNTPLPPRGKFVPVVPDDIGPTVAGALTDWAKHREDKKKPITSLQWEKLVSQARTEGPAFLRKVEYSISQGYQGLFEPTPATNGHTSSPALETPALRQVNVFDRNAPKP